MPVPNTFANATTSIPLSQLDANFATAITLGNTSIQLGNTVTTLNNMTFANVTVSSGSVTVANVTVTGVGTFAAGSNTAPSITTAGDTNTGFFFPAADTVATTTGGTERMRVDSAGQLGLGTTSPGNRLDVVGAGTSQIRVKDGVNATAYYDFGRDGTDGLFGFSGAQTTFSGYKWSVNAGSEVMRITNGGNVGIGTSAPTDKLQVNTQDGVRLGASGAVSYARIGSANTGESTAQISYDRSTGATIISQGNTGSALNERMRIDNSGNLLVGTTTGVSNHRLSVNPAGTDSAAVFAYSSTTEAVNIYNTGNQSYIAIRFLNNAFATVVGSISCSTSATAYNTSSDYRLKENIKAMAGGLSTISSLKPVTYNWISDKSAGEGFIAHELQSVIPAAVTGEKDAVNADGSIKPQGVDYSKIVVHLVAAIQELKAEFDAYKAAHP